MSRGNSIIAGVVLIGVLGTLSIALQATTPSTESFTYVAPMQEKSQVAATAATSPKPEGEPLCTQPIEQTLGKTSGDPKSGLTAEGTICVPGCTYELKKDDKAITHITATEDKCKSSPNAAAMAACRKGNTCVVKECDSKGTCVPLGESDAIKKLSASAQGMSLEDITKAQQLAELAKTNPADAMGQALKESPAIQKAFADAVEEERQITAKNLATELEKIAGGVCGTQGTESCPPEVTKLQDQQNKLNNVDVDALRKNAVALEAGKSPGTTAPDPGPSNPGPSNPDSQGPNGSQRPPSTFPEMGKGGQQGGQQQQNPNNNPYQQCNPQYFCINSTLYWGNTQQNANTYYGINNSNSNNSCQTQVVQRCERGCSGNRCAPAPQDDPQKVPVATLSCGEDKPYDVGMDVPLRFTCTNSETSKGSGFSTGNSMNSSTTVEIKKPPPGADVVSYGLTCVAQGGRTDSVRCDVKINVPSIVMVANPKEVARNASTTIGWITQGMNSCTISSPNAIAGSVLEEFNDDNKDNTSVSGVAVTPGLEDETTFKLTCATKAGGSKEAVIKVKVQ